VSDLIIIIGDNPNTAWEWRLTATGEAGRAQTDAEKTALSTKSFRRLLVVIPGQKVVTKLHTLGNLSDKQKRQAAGFSVEDELAANLDDSHIALDDDTRMAIVANRFMENITTEMSVHGLSPDIICADYDSFANTDSFTYAGRIIQRAGNGLGFAIEMDLAEAVLDAGQALPPQIDSERFLQKIATALAAGHTPINLRQGQFSKSNLNGIASFKRSALLAAAIALAFIGTTVFQGMNTGRKTADLRAQMKTIYTDIYPGADIPDNPALAILRAQADLKSGNKQVFVKLSALLAQSIKDVKGVEISSLRYDAAKGQLSLSIQYSSFDDVEKLKSAVTTSGGIFAESGTRQNGEGLSGDAVLRLKP